MASLGSGPISIATGEVHVWHGIASRLIQGWSDAAIRSVLAESEVRKLSQFPREEVRFEFLATRILIRHLLSAYMPGTLPSQWGFERNKYGKPLIRSQIDRHAFEFNISHSRGIILCAFSLGAQVGVDVECRDKTVPWHDIGKYFSSRELEDLSQLAPGRVPRRFFEYWTLKEAFIKAVGMGLSLPLEEFSFEISPAPNIGIEFSPNINERPSNWKFQLFESVPGYQCAVAVKSSPAVSIVNMGDGSRILGRAA